MVALHGWPYTFVEMLPLAAALPEADVLVPSLPGFGLSIIPHGYVATSQAIADTVHLLVTKELGVERYLVSGEDVGAPVSQCLVATRSGRYVAFTTRMRVFAPRDDLRREEERAFYHWFDAHWDGPMGMPARAMPARTPSLPAWRPRRRDWRHGWWRSVATGATATARWSAGLTRMRC